MSKKHLVFAVFLFSVALIGILLIHCTSNLSLQTKTTLSPSPTSSVAPNSQPFPSPTPLPAASATPQILPKASDSPKSIKNMTASTASTTTTTISLHTNLKWGAYVGDEIGNSATFEAIVGRKMDIQAIFVSWVDETPIMDEYAPTVRDQGKTLLIFWEAQDSRIMSPQQLNFNYDSVIRGDWDVYFKSFAAQAKSYAGPVILVPFDEMNGNWSPWSGTLNGNTAAKHIAAYRHIRNIFRDVFNVSFGWTVNSDSQPPTPENSPEKYYPGNEYVDYVGVDGFNFDNPWQSFEEVFTNALSWIARYPKPIVIFSMASAEGPKKAAWIKDALTIQIPKIPRIAGWIWFNQKKEKNWLISSDAASLAAFKAALR